MPGKAREISQEINKVFRALNTVCTENSKLIGVIRDKLISQGFKPCRGSSIMWDTSTSYNSPNYWLPYFQQMVFFTDKDPNRGIGINILLYDTELDNSISFVSCGLLEGEQKLNYDDFNLFYSAGWVREHGYTTAIFGTTRSIYKTTSVYGNNSVYNYFLSFDLISGPEKVDSLIIHPLLAMYEGKMGDAAAMVSGYALRAEDLS